MTSPRSVRLVEAAVRAVRAGDPLRPVTVVVPSHLLGAWLAPRLFADTGHLAIDFALLPELAWRIAAPRLLAERRGRVPENVDLALLLASATEAIQAEGTPATLREAVALRGFGPAALHTLQDLAAAEVEADRLETAPAVDPERLKLLARLARGLAEGLRAERLVDRTGLFREAAQALPSPAIGGVVLCDPGDAPKAAGRFLDELARTHPVAAVGLRRSTTAAPRHTRRAEAVGARLEPAAVPALPTSAGDEPKATSLARLQARLFEPRGNEDAPLDGTVRVLAAAGESLEAVEIARLVRQALAEGEGTRPSQVAVFLHDWKPYASHLASAFDRAGIEAFFVEGVPRVDPAALGLGLLLDLVGGDLGRRPVMELLTSAQVNWPKVLGQDAPISPARWDRLSAEAGVVSGLGAWRERLRRLRESAEAREFQDDVRYLDSLLRVIEQLGADLDAFPQAGGWAGFLDATLRLLDGWIKRGGLTRERLERVIRPLADHAPSPSREEFLARVRDVLATQAYREGALADERVLVAPIAAARGLSYRLVVIPGLVERSFPPPVRPDPLLLDREREALSEDLPTTRDAVERERLLLQDAVAAANGKVVLSYPRFDTAKGRVRFPSSFLLRAIEAATGRRTKAEDLEALALPGETGLGRAHPKTPDAAIDRIERDLALVASGVRGAAAHLVAGGGTVARAAALDAAAWRPELTAYDGLVDVTTDSERFARLLLAGQRTSATGVQSFAACPYRHLLERGFRLREWTEPEDVYQLDGGTWGSLYHDAVRRLFEWLRDEKALPLKPADVPRAEREIERLVDEAGEALVAEGRILNEKLLEPAKGKVRMELAELLDREAEPDPDGFVPVLFEETYADLAVAIDEERSVTFGGKLDRVDARERPRAVRVIDYKTGQFKWKEGELFRGGRELQLALYNEAVAALQPGAEVAEARYYHSTSAQRFKVKACPATAETAATLRRVLQALDDTARAGAFAPVADTCDYCPFDAICGRFKRERAARKQADPRLAAFRSIREIP